MGINAHARPTAISLAEVISAAKDAHKRGEWLDKCIKLLWRKLYEAVPALDYSHEENKIRDDRRIAGNPDVCDALANILVSQGLPDCIGTQRLARPVFWIMSMHEALVSLQRDTGEKSDYLWYPVRRKYRRAKNKYAKAFTEYLPYLRTNLQFALEAKQNL